MIRIHNYASVRKMEMGNCRTGYFSDENVQVEELLQKKKVKT